MSAMTQTTNCTAVTVTMAFTAYRMHVTGNNTRIIVICRTFILKEYGKQNNRSNSQYQNYRNKNFSKVSRFALTAFILIALFYTLFNRLFLTHKKHPYNSKN